MLTETFKDYRGKTVKRQRNVQLNGVMYNVKEWRNVQGKSELVETGETRIRPVGAFSFLEGENPSVQLAQYTWTDQFFLRTTWDEAIAKLEQKGFTVHQNV